VLVRFVPGGQGEDTRFHWCNIKAYAVISPQSFKYCCSTTQDGVLLIQGDCRHTRVALDAWHEISCITSLQMRILINTPLLRHESTTHFE
jgi:hypothetical protein